MGSTIWVEWSAGLGAWGSIRGLGTGQCCLGGRCCLRGLLWGKRRKEGLLWMGEKKGERKWKEKRDNREKRKEREKKRKEKKRKRKERENGKENRREKGEKRKEKRKRKEREKEKKKRRKEKDSLLALTSRVFRPSRSIHYNTSIDSDCQRIPGFAISSALHITGESFLGFRVRLLGGNLNVSSGRRAGGC